MLPVHKRLIHWLEERGDLDRALEFLPGDAELDRRFADGKGLRSPEFAVLVAYAKLALKEDLLPSELPDDPWFQQTLTDYFPPAVREQYARELAAHPLRRMLEAGLRVTVNSDDPAYFGGYLHDNTAAVTRALGLTADQRRRLAENSFRASFLPEADKARHLAAVAEAAG